MGIVITDEVRDRIAFMKQQAAVTPIGSDGFPDMDDQTLKLDDFVVVYTHDVMPNGFAEHLSLSNRTGARMTAEEIQTFTDAFGLGPKETWLFQTGKHILKMIP